jgi:hypothetical protein
MHKFIGSRAILSCSLTSGPNYHLWPEVISFFLKSFYYKNYFKTNFMNNFKNFRFLDDRITQICHSRTIGNR